MSTWTNQQNNEEPRTVNKDKSCGPWQAADTASPTGERQVRSPDFCRSPKAAEPWLWGEGRRTCLGHRLYPSPWLQPLRPRGLPLGEEQPAKWWSPLPRLETVARRWGLVVPGSWGGASGARGGG